MGMTHCQCGGPNRAAGTIRPRPGRNKKPAPAAPGTSDFLSGFGRAGSAVHEVQRVVGGKLHDAALAQAVEEARPNFRQCTACGTWVCSQVCWNAQANLCEVCAPDFTEQLAANQARAKAMAAREQLEEKARATDYVSKVNMSPGSHIEAATAATNTQAAKTLCGQCGAEVGSSKFCPDCGKPVVKAIPEHCPKCNAETHGHKFCGNCGNKLTD